MAHSVFTFVTTVDKAHIASLDRVLGEMHQAIQKGSADIPHIPFRRLETLHFASFVVFDRNTEEPLLVFENNVDGSIDKYIDDLLDRAAPGIDKIYENCCDYRVEAPRSDKRRFLKESVRKPHVYHIGAAYRRVGSIQEDQALRARLDERVDNLIPPLSHWLENQDIESAVAATSSKWGLAAAVATLAALAALLAGSIWRWVIAALTALVISGAFLRAWHKDRNARRARVALLGARTGREPEARRIWEQIQSEFPVQRYREPRAFVRLKNWLLALSAWPIVTLLVTALWDSPAGLAVFLATFFGLTAVWMVLLIGWPHPKAGRGKSWWLVPIAAIAGASLGFWPASRTWAAVTALLLIGPLAFFAIARSLSVADPSDPREIRGTRGRWRIVPFLLWAAVLSVFSVQILGGLWPPLATASAQRVVALLAFTGAFCGLVRIAILRRQRPRPGVPPWLAMLVVGLGAALFWVVAPPQPFAPWMARAALGFVALAGFVALSTVPLPPPAQPVKPASSQHLRDVTKEEDRDVQNHMSTMVRVRKDGPGRALLLKLFLRTLNVLFYRTVLPDLWRGTLFGIPTVHFAQWTVLDRDHHLFLSNYDFSWTAYLDDFGALLGEGIQKIWGESEDNPGTSDIAAFKDFVRTQMVPHSAWYSAYPGLTTEQIRNNEHIRLELLAGSAPEALVEQLRRLPAERRA